MNEVFIFVLKFVNYEIVRPSELQKITVNESIFVRSMRNSCVTGINKFNIWSTPSHQYDIISRFPPTTPFLLMNIFLFNLIECVGHITRCIKRRYASLSISAKMLLIHRINKKLEDDDLIVHVIKPMSNAFLENPVGIWVRLPPHYPLFVVQGDFG